VLGAVQKLHGHTAGVGRKDPGRMLQAVVSENPPRLPRLNWYDNDSPMVAHEKASTF
jgi:hypothetical protein